MALGGDGYSRIVAWMKIILPLVALGLLSTLFLISRAIDPTQQPIVQIDLEQRAREQGATNPSFAGVTSGGDQVTFVAERARPDLSDPARLIADDVVAELRLLRGTVITITASNADMHQQELTANLDGNVMITTTNGYELTTERLNTRLDILYAETPEQVSGTGPLGTLKAGRMVLTGDEDTDNAEILFTGGVNLIYNPNSSEE